MVCILLLGGAEAHAQSCPPEYVEGEILIRVKADATEEALERVRGLNGESPETVLYAGGPIWVVDLPAGLSVPEAVVLYQADPAVEFAEPNGLMYLDGVSCVEPVVGAGAIVSTTGTLHQPPVTTYQYGSHELVGADLRPRYALDGNVAELNALVGKRVSVTGVVVPGYENGKVEGGPTLLKVTAVEAVPDAAGLPPELISSNARVVVEEGTAEWRNSGFVDDALDGPTAESASLSASYGTVHGTGGERAAWSWSAPVPHGSVGRPSEVTITATDPSGLSSKITFEVGISAVPPAVEVTAPAEGARIGGTTKLSARASDASGIQGPVSFYVNGKEVGQDGEAPYEVEWNPASHPDGPVEVTASARDGYGFAALSAPRMLIVDNPPSADTLRPTILAVSPAAGAGRVAPGANVVATFSERMSGGTLNVSTFNLVRKGTTTKVAATVAYNPSTNAAALNPKASLKRGATYKATVTTGARDLAGNPLAATRTWTFTVRR